MIRIILCLITISLSTIGQVPKDNSIEPKPIEIQQEMQEPIRSLNRDIELAQVKKQNIILQLRLILKVPNDYLYDEPSMSFKPSPKPPEKKEKP